MSVKKSEVEIGATYLAKVSNVICHVTITNEHRTYHGEQHGWVGVNQRTGKPVYIRSAQRLRCRVSSLATTTDQ